MLKRLHIIWLTLAGIGGILTLVAQNAHLKSNSISKELWITRFTKGIPTHLAEILQSIVKRENCACYSGYFKMKGMRLCTKYLGCKEIEKLRENSQNVGILGEGGRKTVYSYEFRNKFPLAVIRFINKESQKRKEFNANAVDNVIELAGSPYVTQLAGWCIGNNNNEIVTEACIENGDLESFLRTDDYGKFKPRVKLEMLIEIVAGFDYLHHTVSPPRVHCDQLSLKNTLRQYVVSDDFHVFMNDLDEVPKIEDDGKVICINYAQITPREPTFLAPEMRFTDVDLRRGTYRKRIGRSTDVWKIPDIALEVLTPKGSPYPIDGMLKTFLEKTEHVHSACKNINEYKRPLSKDVLIEYLKLYNKIIK